MYLQAGLGNQLFMIFALVSFALDYGLDYKILSYAQKTMNGTQTYWNNLLEGFKESVVDTFEVTQNPDENPIISDASYQMYKEPCFAFDQIPSYVADETYALRGFFQSYKYFEHNYEKIKEIMKLKEKVAAIKDEYNHLFSKKTIAVHFRIGDYIGLQAYHCIKGPEYYAYALKEIEKDLQHRGESIHDYNLLYFCQSRDDDYIHQYLKVITLVNKTEYNFVRIPDEIEDWKQMLIMSLCHHFIIANSTFSWFGAYFSENDEKIVYYPQKWFGPALINKHDTKDLCPSSWKAIVA